MNSVLESDNIRFVLFNVNYVWRKCLTTFKGIYLLKRKKWSCCLWILQFIKYSGSQSGVILIPRRQWQSLETFLVVTTHK